MPTLPSAARLRAALHCLILLPPLLAAPALCAAAPSALATQPDIHGDLIAFVHAEDIFTCPAGGGVAKRITFHEGEERYPKFSPDGQRIAFTADYDGNTDVYVMNPEGGKITRVTYHPGRDEVVGWHPTTGKILFRSARDAFSRFTRLYLIAPDGTGLERLPLPEAGWGSFSADGSRIAYTRVATEDSTWKRYRGGLAPDLYLYDFKTGTDRRLTDARGTERFPMWIGATLYFEADPDGVLNLFSLDPESGRQAQLTRFTDYDVGRPSDGSGKIVFDRGGGLELFDPTTGAVTRVAFEVRSDSPEVRPYLKNVKDWITGIGLSPDGNRAVVVARGDVFTVPREKGVIRNLSRDPGSRDKDAVWSPDGKWIAFFSDRSGEYEIWLTDPLGKEPPVRLTTHEDGYRFALRWSPDSKKLAFTDQTLMLSYLEVDTKKITRVHKAEYEAMDLAIDAKPIHDHAWSPDSRFLAYTAMGPDLVNRVFIHSLETKEAKPVTAGPLDAFGPVFSEDGRRLFFVSNRRFDPTYSDLDFELVYKKVAGLYALALEADAPALFPPKTGDEPRKEKSKDSEVSADKKSKPKPKKEPPPKTIVDFAGIAARTEPLPLPRGNYRSLAARAGALFFLDGDQGDFNRFDIREPGARKLQAFDLEERKTRTLVEAVDDYALSDDGTTVVWRKGNEIGIVDATIDANKEMPKAESIDLAGLTMSLDPRAEWRQIYREVWRVERDYFYDPGMHGLDWVAIGRKYQPWIEAAASRAEVRSTIGEMIGELATSHTYVYGGDRHRKPETVAVGMLGADWAADPSSGRYRIERILRSADWTNGTLPPLAAPGVDARNGDLLIAVDGLEVTTEKEVYAAFQGLADKPVRLTLKSGASEPRELVVVPTADESKFRYLDWLERNLEIVEAASGGKIGYMHLPDTFTRTAEMFPLYWYGQTRKDGLIVDGRFNAGGLDPAPFLNRMNDAILFYWTRRYSRDYATPLVATRAHKALLTNRQAGSGGDMLPAEFQLKKMGPVIGTRTWGGLVGISMFTPLVDGGGFTAPDYRVYSTDGKWVIENEGVTPDIVVDLDPAEMAQGHDAQLMRAVDYLMKKIAEEPRPAPARPAFPSEVADGGGE